MQICFAKHSSLNDHTGAVVVARLVAWSFLNQRSVVRIQSTAMFVAVVKLY